MERRDKKTQHTVRASSISVRKLSSSVLATFARRKRPSGPTSLDATPEEASADEQYSKHDKRIMRQNSASTLEKLPKQRHSRKDSSRIRLRRHAKDLTYLNTGFVFPDKGAYSARQYAFKGIALLVFFGVMYGAWVLFFAGSLGIDVFFPEGVHIDVPDKYTAHANVTEESTTLVHIAAHLSIVSALARAQALSSQTTVVILPHTAAMDPTFLDTPLLYTTFLIPQGRLNVSSVLWPDAPESSHAPVRIFFLNTEDRSVAPSSENGKITFPRLSALLVDSLALPAPTVHLHGAETALAAYFLRVSAPHVPVIYTMHDVRHELDYAIPYSAAQSFPGLLPFTYKYTGPWRSRLRRQLCVACVGVAFADVATVASHGLALDLVTGAYRLPHDHLLLPSILRKASTRRFYGISEGVGSEWGEVARKGREARRSDREGTKEDTVRRLSEDHQNTPKAQATRMAYYSRLSRPSKSVPPRETASSSDSVESALQASLLLSAVARHNPFDNPLLSSLDLVFPPLPHAAHVSDPRTYFDGHRNLISYAHVKLKAKRRFVHMNEKRSGESLTNEVRQFFTNRAGKAAQKNKTLLQLESPSENKSETVSSSKGILAKLLRTQTHLSEFSRPWIVCEATDADTPALSVALAVVANASDSQSSAKIFAIVPASSRGSSTVAHGLRALLRRYPNNFATVSDATIAPLLWMAGDIGLILSADNTLGAARALLFGLPLVAPAHGPVGDVARALDPRDARRFRGKRITSRFAGNAHVYCGPTHGTRASHVLDRSGARGGSADSHRDNRERDTKTGTESPRVRGLKSTRGGKQAQITTKKGDFVDSSTLRVSQRESTFSPLDGSSSGPCNTYEDAIRRSVDLWHWRMFSKASSWYDREVFVRRMIDSAVEWGRGAEGEYVGVVRAARAVREERSTISKNGGRDMELENPFSGPTRLPFRETVGEPRDPHALPSRSLFGTLHTTQDNPSRQKCYFLCFGANSPKEIPTAAQHAPDDMEPHHAEYGLDEYEIDEAYDYTETDESDVGLRVIKVWKNTGFIDHKAKDRARKARAQALAQAKAKAKVFAKKAEARSKKSNFNPF